MRRLSSLLLVVAPLSGCVVALPGVTQTVAPPSATLTVTGTDTPSPSATASPEPTWTATTIPTPDLSATPTRITLTPAIIEVTPLGGYPTHPDGQDWIDIEGEYMPFGTLNVRACPAVSVGCGVLGKLSGNVVVQVYGLIAVYPPGDVWLCLDGPPAPYVSSQCDRVVAYIIAGKEYGNLMLY